MTIDEKCVIEVRGRRINPDKIENPTLRRNKEHYDYSGNHSDICPY